MSALRGKIDFTLFISADNANPNGDPLNGNRPRINLDGYGEISDVCIKRKIRNRLQDLGQKIFVQSDDRSDDGRKKPYKLCRRAFRKRTRKQRQRDTAVPPTDKGGRSGHGHAPGYKQILYDDPGGSVPCPSGGGIRKRRRDIRA